MESAYLLRCIYDLHEWLQRMNAWVPLGIADERSVPQPDSVEAWARSPTNPVNGWYGTRPGLRGRFSMYVPPLLEHLGLIELEHNMVNNRCRSRSTESQVLAPLKPLAFG